MPRAAPGRDPEARNMAVHYLAYVADSLTCTIAKALSHGGHELVLHTVDRPEDGRPRDRIQRHLFETPGVAIAGRDDSTLPVQIDRLVVQAFPRPSELFPHVDSLARRARRITLITAGDRSQLWRAAVRLQWLEMRSMARHALRIDRVVYKDGFHPQDLLGLAYPRSVIGFDVHSQFLHDPALFREIHARDWAPDACRPICVSFLGSQDPPQRQRILDEVRPLFDRSDGRARLAGDGRSMFWHEFSDAAPNALPPRDFVRVLTDSDFTLCPRGYSLVTHRPMEALMRGSIPVLAVDELDLYGIGLAHGENCIGVPRGRWADTVGRLPLMHGDEVLRMRQRIAAMFSIRLDYENVAGRIRARVAG